MKWTIYDPFTRKTIETDNLLKRADLVEVVRCADCKHYWKNHTDGDSVSVCLASPSDDAFCSEGERRTND